MAGRYHVTTFGCQMNVHDSERMKGMLESLEQYVKRLHELEAIACRHTGVDKVYAMHAGREIRVIVHPEEIDDDAATLLSHQIARDVEKELEYPGQIKVTVIRESRAVDYAK